MKILTPTILFPLIIETIDKTIAAKIIERHFFDPNKFAPDYPLPSVALNDPSFNPAESLYLWRGPTWVFHNWLLSQVLTKHGHQQAADELARTVTRLIEASGFREYYNPLTGQGMGAEGFTWAGLVIDMIRAKS